MGVDQECRGGGGVQFLHVTSQYDQVDGKVP